MNPPIAGVSLLGLGILATAAILVSEQTRPEVQAPPKAVVDGTESGWTTLGERDFAGVNGDPDTWKWTNGQLASTGVPIGVLRSVKRYTNFELLVEWRMLKAAG